MKLDKDYYVDGQLPHTLGPPLPSQKGAYGKEHHYPKKKRKEPIRTDVTHTQTFP